MDKPCTYWYFTQPTTVTPDGQQWPMTLEDYTFLKDQCMSVTYEDLVCHHHHIGYPVHVQIDNDCNDSSKSLTMNLEGDGTYLAFHTKRYTGKAAVIRVAHLGIGPGTHVHFLPGGCHEGLLVEWWEHVPLCSLDMHMNLSRQKATDVIDRMIRYRVVIDQLQEDLDRKYNPIPQTKTCVGLEFLSLVCDELKQLIQQDPRYHDESSSIFEIIQTNPDIVKFKECSECSSEHSE